MSEEMDSDVTIEPLDRMERRIVGVLVEKAFCTPESYPLTLNAIVTGCNQKSARDPVMEVTNDDVEAALESLKEKHLVECIFPATGRANRWKHVLKEAWDADGKERAILGELLLRGPQTEGEIRSRASRMQELGSIEEVNEILGRLANDGFVQRISPEGRKRGVVWIHCFYPPEEAARLQDHLSVLDQAPTELAAPPMPVRSASPAANDRWVMLEESIAELRGKLADLSEAFDALSAKVDRMTG